MFSSGDTLSVSLPCNEGHIPAWAGLVPQMVLKPKRTCESSFTITDSIAVLSVYEEVSIRLVQNVLSAEAVEHAAGGDRRQVTAGSAGRT